MTTEVRDWLLSDHGYTPERADQALKDHADAIKGMAEKGRNARDTADLIARRECPGAFELPAIC